MYKERIAQGYKHEDIMESIYAKGRDNARTPMQWDDSEFGGFSTVEPWLGVNSNYKTINAKEALENRDSIFYHYKKLIDIRKNNEIIIYGDYELLNPEDENVFAYIRELNGEKILVVCNFKENPAKFMLKEDLDKEPEILLSNYKDSAVNLYELNLRPYEAIMYKIK